MKSIKTADQRAKFAILLATKHAQSAMMTLAPGQTSDDKLSNEHPHCEQWLYVVSGQGRVTTKKKNGQRRNTPIRTGMLIIVERNELHQIKNSGTKPLRTLNLYVPPAYLADGRPRPTATTRNS